MKNSLVCFLAAALLMTGCTQNIGDFTLLSTKNVDLSVCSKAHRAAKVRGVDALHVIIFFPTKVDVNMKTAVDRAIEAVPGGFALADVRLKFINFYIFPLYGQTAYIAEGTALVNAAQASHFPTRNVVVRYDGVQKHYVAKGVTAQEYATLSRGGAQPWSATAIQ